MPLFVILAMDKVSSAALRAETRPARLEFLNNLGDRLKLGGPFTNAAGESIGSMLIVETEDREAADAIVANDPFVAAGLFQTLIVSPWRSAVGTGLAAAEA